MDDLHSSRTLCPPYSIAHHLLFTDMTSLSSPLLLEHSVENGN